MCPPVSARCLREGLSHLHASWRYQVRHGERLRVCFLCFKAAFLELKEALGADDWEDEDWDPEPAESPEAVATLRGAEDAGPSAPVGSEDGGPDPHFVPTELEPQDVAPLGPEDANWTQALPWRLPGPPDCPHWPSPSPPWQGVLRVDLPPGEPMVLELQPALGLEPAAAKAALLQLQVTSMVGCFDAIYLRRMAPALALRGPGQRWRLLLEPDEVWVVRLQDAPQPQDLHRWRLSVLEASAAGQNEELVPADAALLRRGFTILSYSPWRRRAAAEGAETSGPAASWQGLEPGGPQTRAGEPAGPRESLAVGGASGPGQLPRPAPSPGPGTGHQGAITGAGASRGRGASAGSDGDAVTRETRPVGVTGQGGETARDWLAVRGALPRGHSSEPARLSGDTWRAPALLDVLGARRALPAALTPVRAGGGRAQSRAALQVALGSLALLICSSQSPEVCVKPSGRAPKPLVCLDPGLGQRSPGSPCLAVAGAQEGTAVPSRPAAVTRLSFRLQSWRGPARARVPGRAEPRMDKAVLPGTLTSCRRRDTARASPQRQKENTREETELCSTAPQKRASSALTDARICSFWRLSNVWSAPLLRGERLRPRRGRAPTSCTASSVSSFLEPPSPWSSNSGAVASPFPASLVQRPPIRSS